MRSTWELDTLHVLQKGSVVIAEKLGNGYSMLQRCSTTENLLVSANLGPLLAPPLVRSKHNRLPDLEYEIRDLLVIRVEGSFTSCSSRCHASDGHTTPTSQNLLASLQFICPYSDLFHETSSPSPSWVRDPSPTNASPPRRPQRTKRSNPRPSELSSSSILSESHSELKVPLT